MNKIVEFIKRFKIIFIFILLLIVIYFLIYYFYLRHVYGIKSIDIDVNNNIAGTVIYSPYENSKIVILKDENVELIISNHPSKYKLFYKCYYDNKIISVKDNIITAISKGTTEIYCESKSKIKSNVIDIEVQ